LSRKSPLSLLRINDASQDRKQVRLSLDFVQDKQVSLMPGKVVFGIAQLGQIGGQFQIEIGGFGIPFDELKRQRGFSNLSGPKQGNSRKAGEQVG
jgi:hypothetical protein